MTEPTLNHWNSVTGYMEPDFRTVVVEIALHQREHASADLRKIVNAAFSEVKVPGFRSFQRAPVRVALPYVERKFSQSREVANAIIALWSEAQTTIISEIRVRGKDDGLFFKTPWTWGEAAEGYYDFDYVPKFDSFINQLIENKEKPESDHFKLAQLWLSCALCEKEEAEQNTLVSPPTDGDELELAKRNDQLSFGLETEDEAAVAIEGEELSMSETPTREEVAPPVEELTVADEQIPGPEYVTAEPEETIVQPTETEQQVEPESPEFPKPEPVESTEPETADQSELQESQENEWDNRNLNELLETTSQIQAAIRKTQSKMREALLSMIACIDKEDCAGLDQSVEPLEEAIKDWKKRYHELEAFENYSYDRLEKELALRPDILSNALNEQPELEKLAEGFKAVLSYDAKKRTFLQEIDQLKDEISLAEQLSAEWNDTLSSFDRENRSFVSSSEPADMTVENLIELKAHLQRDLTVLNSSNLEKRNMTIGLIKKYSAKLLELKKNPSDVIAEEMTLGQMEQANFNTWSVKRIQKLEKTLQIEFTKNLPGDIAEVAAALRQKWSQKDFEELLRSLAVHDRNVEILLFLLATALGNKTNEVITLPSTVYANILKGAHELVGYEKSYELLGKAFPVLLSGYLLEEDERIHELCFTGLALQSAGLLQEEDGLLWQVAKEWPVQGMEGWSKLWQSSLYGKTCAIYSDDAKDILKGQLDQARGKVESLFTKDGGHFYKLNSLRSHRHMTMMDRLLQEIAEKRDGLEVFETRLNQAEPKKLPSLFIEISKIIKKDMQEELSETKLAEMYENGIREDRIIDTNPFLTRTCNNILSECANSLIEYGQAILDYWNLTLQRIDGVDSDTLRSELKMIPDLSEESRKAINIILQPQIVDYPSINDSSDLELPDQLIVYGILDNPTLVRSLPRIIGYAVETDELDWDTILDLLEQDMAVPMEPQEIAYFLLEDHKAPNQVLRIVQDISLEQQNQAQALESEFEHQTYRLSSEVLQLGGRTDDLSIAKDSGRWDWLIRELKLRAKELRAVAESKRLEEETQIRKYRATIQDLDNQIFELRNEMPEIVYETLNKGLAVVRRLYDKPKLFDALDEFCKEIDYRIAHKSWAVEPIRQAVDLLDKKGAGVFDERKGTLTAESLLSHLEQNDLTPLGLSSNNIASTAIETRVSILKNWIKIKKISSVQSKHLTQSEILTTTSLYSYFAQMVSMNRYVTDFNKSLDSADPVVHQFWEMRYPKTNALDKPYVFMTLPGDPPTPDNIRDIEEFIDGKELLEDKYVLLFVPGCNEKVMRRLDKKGLVIIDEARLIGMLIAEASNNIPLGVLRPLALNAIDANSDIFIINQSVNARTAIFEGRTSLVDRIVNSGDNYAIYGGRRIGKSSVMKAIEQKLGKGSGYRTISLSIEGETNASDEHISYRIAQMLDFDIDISSFKSLKETISNLMDNNPEIKLAIFLDEIDRYIQNNKERHILIETLRACSDRYGNRFRVIIAGFMSLYDCLHGKGPYSPNSDPWMRMFTDNRELENLTPSNAEKIVREGFISILGWKFENQAIPQRIVERTGGHPAFVQQFCSILLERVRTRKDKTVLLSDVESVFNDPDPNTSFIAYVKNTFNLNLDPVSNYLILWMSLEASEAQSFTMGNIKNVAAQSSVEIPEKDLMRSLEKLKVTSVIRERVTDLFYFTVPDYPMILNKLGTTAHLDEVENELRAEYEKA